MKMRMMIAVSILALAICASTARAALIAYEGFNYSGTDLDTLNGGTGFATAWTGTSDLSDDDTSLPHLGNPNPVTGDHVNYLRPSYRTLTTPLTYTTGDTYYMSYLLRKDSPTAGPYLKLVNGAHASNNYTYRTWFGGIGGGNDKFSYGGPTGHSIDLGYTPGNVVMVVTKLVALPDTSQYERSYSWFESPATVSTTEPTWDVQDIESASTKARGADTLWILSSGGGSIDEIRIGTTYADVVIPEPITLTVLGLGSVLLVLRRRR